MRVRIGNLRILCSIFLFWIHHPFMAKMRILRREEMIDAIFPSFSARCIIVEQATP